MAKRKAAPPVDEVEEVEDLEEVEEVEDEVPDDISESTADEGEGLTAKELARELKTDGRTVRKFLRKKYGKVGQGARWVIDPALVEDLRKEFAEYGRSTKSEAKAKKIELDEDIDEVEELSNEELEEISDLDDDLETLDDLDFDEVD